MELVAIFNTKTVDTDGTKQFLGEEMPVCERCGKSHTVVCQITDNGKTMFVGTTCAKKMLGAHYNENERRAKMVASAVNALAEKIAEHKKQNSLNIGFYFSRHPDNIRRAALQFAVDKNLLIKTESGWIIN